MVTETNKIIAVQSILKIAAALSARDMNRMEFALLQRSVVNIY